MSFLWGVTGVDGEGVGSICLSPCFPGVSPTAISMRVLFLTDSLSDLDGVGRYGVRLLGALEDAGEGLEVEVLLGRRHRPNSDEVRDSWKVQVGRRLLTGNAVTCLREISL